MVSKEERHRLELAVHAARHEAGTQAIRSVLYEMRDDLNRKWPAASGEDFPRLQGSARVVGMLIKMIDLGPTIKDIGGTQ